MYEVDKLKEYISSTQVITINDDLKIRMSDALLNKYNNGSYDKALTQMLDCIKQIDALGIKYPGNAHPVFYIYVLPDENFKELLKYSSTRSSDGGGKPVVCYDLDGYNRAFGVNNSLLESNDDNSISTTSNIIHEFAHLVYNMFYYGERFLDEGFAEALPLYTMDYESKFDEHREMLGTLTEEQILSAQQLIKLSENNHFNAGAVAPNKSCSFDYSYISSYLFVRGCIETIAKKEHLNRIQATQRFLETIKTSERYQQWLVFDIANSIGMPQEELLIGKEMQLNVLKELANEITGPL